ncbi:MAG: EVE domain-containing protein [Anaeromyxobacter sp.]
MAYWLLKTEPDVYGWEDLVREGRTAWTGVSNPQAQKNLRAMKPGDRAVIYHSGEKRAVGVAEVVKTAYPDPTAEGETVCVDVKPGEPLPAPVPLEALKQEAAFEGSALLRQGRLSVVPLVPAEWKALTALAEVIAKTGAEAEEAVLAGGLRRQGERRRTRSPARARSGTNSRAAASPSAAAAPEARRDDSQRDHDRARSPFDRLRANGLTFAAARITR